ncbi:MAG: hypothetical protein KGI83_07165, partial [Verrucomicrobiota bacterium]|nr:hypothetical protein [Verrucomicrobiota bacterium]
MTTVQCSDFTRNLYQLQINFDAQYRADSSATGLVMRHLVSRIISVGVTLLLHAEAVCRVVAVCFQNIRQI